MQEENIFTRRDLITRSVGVAGVFTLGGSFIAAADAAWALEVKHLQPQTMASLVQLARDIYPHDRIGDEFYAIAVKGYDTPEQAPNIEAGISMLDNMSGGNYLSIGWEADRNAVLRRIQDTDFFQMIRGGLVVGLYNQKEVWPIFGYEGESYSKGGYVDRGFNDISWL